MDVYFNFSGFFSKLARWVWIPLILIALSFGLFSVLDSMNNTPFYLASADILLSLEELNGGLPLNQPVSMPSNSMPEEESDVLDFLLPQTPASPTSSAPTVIKGNNIDSAWVRTCGLVFGSQQVLAASISQAGLELSYKEAVKNMRISYPSDTVIRIGFVYSDSDIAVKMVQLLVQNGIKNVDEKIDLPKVKSTVLAEPVWANIQGQVLPSAAYQSTVFTFILLLYVIIISAVTLVDPRIQSYAMAENVLGTRFLGAIRNAKRTEDLQLLTLALKKQAEGARSLLFCTASGDDGCSNLLAGLAEQLNDSGRKTLVIDAKTNQENPLEKLKEYDLILIDAPPVNESNTASLLASSCDRTVFVVRYYKTSIHEAVHAVHGLENAGAKLAGFVVTGVGRNVLYKAEFSKQSRPAAQ